MHEMYGTENWDTQHSSELPYIVIPTNGIKCVSLCKTNRNMTNSQKIFLKGTTEDKNASAFVMKGDYNTSIDQDPISYNQVVGLYKGRIAGIGGVANFLQSPIGVIVVLGLPLACILIIDLIKKKKENQLANSKNAELETELAQLKAEKAQKGWKDSSR